MRKKLTAALLAAGMAVSMIAAPVTAYGETRTDINIAIPLDPTTLAPNGMSGLGFTTAQLYDQLWYLTDGERIMRLATGVEMEDDTHFLVTIQSGIQDIEGNEITASDVLYSIELAKNGTQGYPGATNFIDIENSEVVDDTTVRLALTQPCSFQMDALSMVNIVTQAAYEASPDGMATTPVGSGPYKLVEYVSGSYAVLEANEDYWDGAPAIKDVRLQFITEASQRTNAFLTGEADFVCWLPAIDAPTVEGMEGVTVSAGASLGVDNLFFNCSSQSVCNNADLRKAIASAINNDAVMQAAYLGYGESTMASTSSLFGDYNPEWESFGDGTYYGYDVEKARNYLEASGVSEGTTIKLITSAMNEEIAETEVIQANLAELGLNVEITTFQDTLANVIVNQPGDWDIAVWSISNFPAQSSLATLNTFVGTTNNPGLEGNDRELLINDIAEAVAAYEEEENKEAMTKLMSDMYDILPMYGMFNRPDINAWNENLNVSYKCQNYPLIAEWSWNE